MIKKIKNILLFIPLLILLIIISISCSINVEEHEQYESVRTKEIVKKSANWIDTPIYTLESDNIGIGELFYTSGSLNYQHYLSCSITLNFNIEKVENNNYKISSISGRFSNYISTPISSLNNSFSTTYSNYSNFSYNTGDFLTLENINRITLSVQLLRSNSSQVFYGNLYTRLTFEIYYNSGDREIFRNDLYYDYSPKVNYTYWNYTTASEPTILDIPLFHDIFMAGGEYFYEEGYRTGYEVGYTDGEDNTYNNSWLESIFNAVNVIFSIEVFPGFKLWFLIGAPLMISLVVAVFKILR